MNVIAIVNHKGGVGKTTTALNLAVPLAVEHQKRVLAMDLDSQGHLSKHLGRRVDRESPMFRMLARGETIAACAEPTGYGFDVVAGGRDVGAAQALMRTDVTGNGRMQLREALAEIPVGTWDVVLLDCPPALADMTTAALIAANAAIIPLPMEDLPLDGMIELLKTIEGVRKYDNPKLTVRAVFETMSNPNTILSATIREDVQQRLAGSDVFSGDALLTQRVRRNIPLAEAARAQRPVSAYNPMCHGAEDYRALAAELVARGVA